jgi:hypothetical protein
VFGSVGIDVHSADGVLHSGCGLRNSCRGRMFVILHESLTTTKLTKPTGGIPVPLTSIPHRGICQACRQMPNPQC